MPDTDFKIQIISDADNTGFKSAAAASADLNKEMGVITVSNADVEAATKKTTAAVAEGTEKFGGSRRELREAGNELGRAAGISRLGALALGGMAAAAFAAGKAVEFLKDTWDTIQESITGPIQIGLPDDAPGKISAAAEAWRDYAAARAAVIAAQNSPEAGASAEEKKLANELKLIHEVLAAQKEKALADLESQKGSLSPEAHAAARANIGSIFGEAGTAADEKTRQEQIANKATEATNLEIDAQKKTAQALAIKSAPKDVAEANEKTLDENAAAAEKAKKDIQDRIDFIKNCQTRTVKADYAGVMGKVQAHLDAGRFHFRYGDSASIEDALGIEQPRLDQANAAINAAKTYRDRQTAAAAEKKRLMDEAGNESGRAAGLRDEVNTDRANAAQQSGVDTYVAGLHDQAAQKISGASAQTTQAVQKVLATTIGGFADVHAVFQKHERQLADQAAKIRALTGQQHAAAKTQ